MTALDPLPSDDEARKPLGRVWMPIVVAVAAVSVGGTLGVLALVGGDDDLNDATRSGCRTMADVVTRMDPAGSNRAQIRSFIGAAMVEFGDSNDDVIRNAAADVEQAYTSLDDSLYLSSIRTIDNRCREHFAAGWGSRAIEGGQ